MIKITLQLPYHSKTLTIPEVKQFNLFIGQNECGKTRTLKAIQEMYKDQGVATKYISGDLPEKKYLIRSFEWLHPTKKEILLRTLERVFGFTGNLYTMGNGGLRTIQTAVAIFDTENGVLFVDELSRSLHYTATSKLIPFFAEIAEQFNVKIFATTHDPNCWGSLVRIKKDIFTLHRIERDQDETIMFSPNKVRAATECNVRID